MLSSNPLCCRQPVCLRTLNNDAQIQIDDRVGISGSTICAANKITIGSNTLIGSGCTIVDNDFHERNIDNNSWESPNIRNAEPVIIGKNVFIGMYSIILKGVTIGDGATIGAGSVIYKDVPANTVVSSNKQYKL